MNMQRVIWVLVWTALPAASFLLAAHTDPAALHNDSVHMTTAARNFANGNGLASDVIFYDAQHRLGRLPVPITNWPPGFPILLAGFVLLGLSPVTAALAINYFCVGGSVALVGVILKQRGVSPLLIVAGSMTVLLYFPNWYYARYAGTSACMIFTTLLTTLSLGLWHRTEAKRWIYLCGIVAGMSFSFRYAALFFIASVGLVLVVNWINRLKTTHACDVLRFAIPAAVVILLILGRNYAEVGSFFDRPRAASPNTTAVSKQAVWAFSALTGISKTSIQQLRPATLLTLACALVLGAFLLVQRKTPNHNRRRWWSTIAAIYPTFTLVALAACSVMTSFPFIHPRYLFVVVPFIVIAVTIRLDAMTKHATNPTRQRCLLAGLLLCCSATQIDKAIHHTDPVAVRNRALRTALQTTLGSQTIYDFLHKAASTEHPLLCDRPQMAALAIDRPIVGIATTNFGAMQLNADTGLELVRRFKCQFVLLQRNEFDAEDPLRANQPLFADINTGHLPPWLESMFEDDNLVLCRVVDP